MTSEQRHRNLAAFLGIEPVNPRKDTPMTDEVPLVQHASTKDGELIWIYSMGKRFQIRAITTTVDSANEYMDKHEETALIACFGPFNIIANKYEGVRL